MSASPQQTSGLCLDRRAAIVTGAGSGIGKATALAFAAAGAAVAVLDVHTDSAEETTAEITSNGGKAIAIVADVGDEDATTAAVARATAELGPIALLVNNAGMIDDMAPPERASLDLWQRVIRVNLTGPFLMSREVLPGMLEAGHGVILNVGSAASLRGGTAGVSYTASKHGVLGLTRSLAYSYGDRGIRVNAILPGPTQTNIAGHGGHLDQAGIEKLAPVIGLSTSVSGGRIAQPEEMASALLFLASDAATFVNGAALPVDAGWAAA